MTSLRTRIAAVLITAIVAVVLMASFVATRMMSPPHPEVTIEPIARQLGTILALMQTGVESPAPALRPQPDNGPLDPFMTQLLTEALRRTGTPLEGRITGKRGGTGAAMTASVRAPDGGWLVMQIPSLAPPEGRGQALAIWLGLIVLGSAVIALHMARMLTRPLDVLDATAAQIGEQGTFHLIPETGPVETRAAASALNRLQASLRQAMESRMRLVAAAGHDLRTPMTRMRLRAEFIEDEAERARWLADLAELEAIADSAMILVREETVQDEREAIRLDRLVESIAADMADFSQRITLGVMAPLTITAGRLSLTRALRNLMVNAATHGGGGRVTLAREDTEAVLAIEDEGPGIPPELLDQVFEPFFRADAARRKSFPGAGLGLAIARMIIERHGGRIEIVNRSTGGLRQVCRIPLG